jgi:beta-lactamase class A
MNISFSVKKKNLSLYLIMIALLSILASIIAIIIVRYTNLTEQQLINYKPEGSSPQSSFQMDLTPESYPLASIANTYSYTSGQIDPAVHLEENKANVVAYLKEKRLESYYGIYFYDTKYDNTFEHNSTATFKPASIYKVPLAILTLKEIERGKFTLEEKILHNGSWQTIDFVIDVMITESNNDSMASLENKMGGYYPTQDLMQQDLGLQVKRAGQITSARDIGTIYKILYDSYKGQSDVYLSKKSADYLINYMLTAQPRHRDRIPTAVESFNNQNNLKNQKALKTANKIGNLNGVYQDAAIIFGNNSDYILVILNKSRLTYKAVDEIHEITKTLLNNLE